MPAWSQSPGRSLGAPSPSAGSTTGRGPPWGASRWEGEPCEPQYPFPLGETLQVTVNSTQKTQGQAVDHDHPVDTIRGLFTALRACWRPPDADEAHPGMQMSVRFAFKRN